MLYPAYGNQIKFHDKSMDKTYIEACVCVRVFPNTFSHRQFFSPMRKANRELQKLRSKSFVNISNVQQKRKSNHIDREGERTYSIFHLIHRIGMQGR